MAAEIEGLSLQITTTSGQAAGALKKLNRQLAELETILNSMDTSKLSASFRQLGQTLKENGIVVNHYVKQTKEVKQASEDMASGVNSATGSFVKLKEIQANATTGLEEVTQSASNESQAMDSTSSSASGLGAVLSMLGANSSTLGGIFGQVTSMAGTTARAFALTEEETAALSSTLGTLSVAGGVVAGVVEGIKRGIEQAFELAKKGKQIVETAVKLVQKLSKALADKTGFTKLKQEIKSVLSMLKRQVLRRLISNYISAIEDAFDTGITNLEAYDERFSSAMRSYRNAMGLFRNSVTVALAPLISYFIPYIVKFINNLTWACNQIARLTALLTGQHTYTIAKSYEEIADSATAAGTAAKEAAKTILGFDEINQLHDNKSSSSGSGSGSGDGVSAYETVEVGNWPYKTWGEAFSSFLNWLNGKLPSLNKILTTAAEKFNDFNAKLYEMFTFEGVQDKISELGAGIGEALNNFFNHGLDWQMWGKAVGIAIESALNFTANLIDSFDFVALGKNITDFIVNAIGEIKPDHLAKVLTFPITAGIKLLGGILSNPRLAELATFGAKVANSMLYAIRDAFESVPWKQVKDTVIKSINNFFDNLDVKEFFRVVDEVGNTIYDIVVSALDALVSNPKFLRIVLGTFSRLAILAVRAIFDTVTRLIPDALANLMGLYNTTDLGEHEADLWDLYDPMLAGVDGVKQHLSEAYSDMTEQTSEAVNAIVNITDKGVTHLYDNTNKTADSVRTTVQTQTTQMRETHAREMSLMASNTTKYLKPMADDATKYSLNAKNALVNNLTSAGTSATKSASGIQVSVSSKLSGLSKAATSGINGLNKNITSGLALAKTNAVTGASGIQIAVSSKLSGLSKTATSGINGLNKNIVSGLATAKTNATKSATDTKRSVTDAFKSMSSDTQNSINGLSKSVTSGLSSVSSNAIKSATDAQKGVTNAFNSMYSGAKGGMNNMISGAEKMANGIIDANNSIIKSFDSVSIGGKKAAPSSGYVNKIAIPKLATGGIISHPTQAILGERGAEAVMPLERNTGWIDRLANTLAESVSQSSVSSQSGDIYVTLDGKVIAKAVNRYNERNTRRYSPVG